MGLNPIQVAVQGVQSLLGLTAPLADIRKGFTFGYVIEIVDTTKSGSVKGGELIDAHVFVLNPARYTLSEPHQSTLTPAEDDTVVAEENGIIVREITLEGTHGLKRKQVTGYDGRQDSAGAVSGNQHFLHLRNLFRVYSDLKKGRPSKRTGLRAFAIPSNIEPANVQMVFHSMREDDHFIVVPRSFETPRDARTRVHFPYRITMAAIAETSRDVEEDQGLFGVFDSIVSDIGQAVNDARAFFSDMTSALDEIKNRVRAIDNLVFNAAQLINAGGSFVRSVTGFVPFGIDAAKNIVETLDISADRLEHSLDQAGRNVGIGPQRDDLERAANDIRKTSAALTVMLVYPNTFGQPPVENVTISYSGESGLTQSDVTNGTSGATSGSRTRVQSGSARTKGINVGNFNTQNGVVVRRGDTIASLAASHNVTQEGIILANDLRAPYIAPGGGPGVLKPGDTVLIPASSVGRLAGVQPADEYLTNDEALYGIDYALDESLWEKGILDLKINASGGSVDIDLARGANNVVQGTLITLSTERGETVHVPNVGIRKRVGIKGDLHNLVFASIVLRDGILSDPRVEDIFESTVRLEGDQLIQDVTPILSQQRRGATFTIPFGKASGKGA